MGENEKLGFLCATTPWVESGTIATTPWTGNPMPSITDGIGINMSGNLIYKPNTPCGKIPKPSPSHAERMASLKTEMDAMAEKYKPIADKLLEEIYKSSQEPIQPISEKVAKELEDACNKHLGTLSELSKSLNPSLDRLITHLCKPSKRKKHYKPKFTL